jgi:Ni,Fe-hydrogenase maturation factor
VYHQPVISNKRDNKIDFGAIFGTLIIIKMEKTYIKLRFQTPLEIMQVIFYLNFITTAILGSHIFWAIFSKQVQYTKFKNKMSINIANTARVVASQILGWG